MGFIDPAASGAASRTTLSCSIDDHDRYPTVSGVAFLGVVAALSMAAFGLPPVDIHGPLHWFGIMDPLCGGTWAARYVAEGNLRMAWRYNPLSIFVVAFGAAVVARAFLGIATRRWVTLTIEWTARGRTTALGATFVLLVLLEVRQQSLAAMLLARR